jgi:hypothetical protein
MTRDPDRRPNDPVTLREAEEASERLTREIEHTKRVLRDYRTMLGEDLADTTSARRPARVS